MTQLWAIFLWAPALVFFAVTAFLALEIAGALLPRRIAPSRPDPGPVAIIVPAHNEASTIKPTLADVSRQLRHGDRLLVVADNCTDDTGEVAMRAGASVLFRNEPEKRGKGFALQYALSALRDDPPEIVVFVDADCRIEEGALRKLAAAAEVGRPAQALYLMKAPAEAPVSRSVSEFAWVLLNRVRMSGLYSLFDVCRLTGAGMAFRWDVIEGATFAGPEIVEDLALTIDFVERGKAPVFCPDAVLTSEFPVAAESAVIQRARWEHGSLRLAFRRALPLLVKAIVSGDIRLGAAALDLAVPPLTVLVAATLFLTILSAVSAYFGASAPLTLCGVTIALFATAIFVAWAGFGRNALPLSRSPALGAYLFRKISVYGARARRSTTRWTRTDRNTDVMNTDEDR